MPGTRRYRRLDVWQTARSRVSALDGPEVGPSDQRRRMLFESIEQLAWPAEQLDDAIANALMHLRVAVVMSTAPAGYTVEQWDTAIQAFDEDLRPVFNAHAAKVSVAVGGHWHAGLIDALNATVATAAA